MWYPSKKVLNINMFVFSIIFNIFANISNTDTCVLEYRKMNYFKIKTCHRSELSQIGFKNVDSFKDCVKFARERNGLAFNYSPTEVSGNMLKKDKYFTNCQIMGCPELSNTTTLIPDENFDYYSAFGNTNNTVNATCISSTGVFAISHEKQDYVRSTNSCQNIGADLADVLTETRTKQLANLVNETIDSWYKASYVGLDDLLNDGLFESSNGNHIHCTQYRAWGPGHPQTRRKQEHCVTLHSDKTWKVVPCNVELTAICEFFPEPPPIDEFDERYLCNEIRSKRLKRRCLADKRAFRKLIEGSTRRDKCALLNYNEEIARH